MNFSKLILAMSLRLLQNEMKFIKSQKNKISKIFRKIGKMKHAPRNLDMGKRKKYVCFEYYLKITFKINYI